MTEVDGALTRYASAIDRILSTISRKNAEIADDVMSALIAREKLSKEIAAHPITETEILFGLAEQDQRLKNAAKLITKRLGPDVLKNWREISSRNTDAWWWSLDTRAAAEKSRLELVSGALAWILVAVSLSFSVEIVRRYLIGGADFASIVLQGLIALIAGGAIFKGARQFFQAGSEPSLGNRILSTSRSQWLVVILLIGFSSALVLSRQPVARIYNDQGVKEYENRRLTNAIDKYKHALSLDPALAETHFNLGNAYEEVLQYDRAINEYTEAILANQDFYRPYNNLARLYILHRADYVGALKLIDKALTLKVDPAESDPSIIEYALYKNRAWANLNLKNYKQAQEDLALALMKRNDGISMHCLLAQVLEAQGNREGALEHWKLCRDLTATQKTETHQRYEIDEPEANWIETAKDRLNGN